MWKIKTRYENSLFDYCLIKNSKKENKERLFKFSFNNDSMQLSDLENILKQFKDLEQIEIKDITLIQSDCFTQIEKDEIFIKNIIGSQNSTISDVIKKLGNSDWVKDGKKFLGNDNICPFCQKETIGNDFKRQLEEYFDESYELDMSKLQGNLGSYQDFYNMITANNSFLENYFIKAKKEYELEFHNLYSTLMNGIGKNIESMKEKIKEPSKSIHLQDNNPLFDNLNIFLQKIQQEINQYKIDFENKNQKRKEIKELFWQIMRNNHDDIIKEYENNKNELEKELENVESEIKQSEYIIQENKQKIVELQSQILNIENTVNAINSNLKEMGIVDFFIEKHNENFYRIARENDIKINFKTLSEGEKTIISFLYFLQLCKGKESGDEITNGKIVVIDDPISSLSHNHVFNISQLIHQNCFKQNDDIKQIFILTHNLYFFHEIIHLVVGKKGESKNTKIYRLTKYTNSRIEEIKRGDILNEYESYWHIVIECKNNPQESERYRHILPNTMRNILEYFFAFVNKDKYNEFLKNQASFQCEAFLRYLNRESHSDGENITDFKEMDISKILEDFENIFKKSNNEAHYKKYMRLS